MLPKAIVAAFVVASGDALRVDGLHTRRTLIGTAASSAASALSLVPIAAFAEGLQKASDAAIYARADANELKVATAIERTKSGDLANGASATCEELDALISVDRKAAETERKAGEDPKTIGQLRLQIEKLDKLRAEKGCETASVNLKQASDFDVYKRADEGDLKMARVIERAKQGKLVDGSGASINELSRIIAVDKKAIKLEKERVDASREELKQLEQTEKAIDAQVKKLELLRRQKRLANEIE